MPTQASQRRWIPKFCETCGTRILDPIVPPTPSAPEPSEAPAPEVQPAVLNLDSMNDDDDDIKDVDIVHTDDSSLAPVNDSSDGDDDSDDDDATDTDSDGSAIDSADDDDDDSSDDTDADVDADADDALDSDGDDDSDDDDATTIPAATYLTTSAPAVTTAVAEMNTWAKQWEVAEDPFVKGLNEAIQQNNDLGMWSSLDPPNSCPTCQTRPRFSIASATFSRYFATFWCSCPLRLPGKQSQKPPMPTASGTAKLRPLVKPEFFRKTSWTSGQMVTAFWTAVSPFHILESLTSGSSLELSQSHLFQCTHGTRRQGKRRSSSGI